MAVGALRIDSSPPATADLVIIGGGVAGAALAFFARRAGLDAVIVERRPMLGTWSTAAATGAFRLQFDNPEEMALVRESLAFFHHFEEESGLARFDLGLEAPGYLWVATDETLAARQCALVERQRGWGLDDVELIAGADLRRRFPYLGEAARQARFRAGDGWLDPPRLTLGLARASGARIAAPVEVLGLDVRSGAVRGVVTDRGVISTAAVVIAAGNRSASLAASVGLALPIVLQRRHRLVLLDVPEVPANAPMTIDEATGTHWRPAGRGAHVMWPDPDEPAGEPLDDVPTHEAFAFAVLDPSSQNAAAQMVPFWRSVWERGVGAWLLKAGQYDLTPDHRALLGATPVAGLFLDTGHSGHGVMTSVGAARRVVDAVLGRLRPEDNPFRLDRDMGSRERDVL
jgi:sarcosine oxidase subunit beta